MNYRLIVNILGRVLIIQAGLLLLPMVVAAIYRESVLPFVYTILIVLAVGLLLTFVTRRRETEMHPREGFVTVALSWIVMSLFGALPYIFSGAIPNYVDALFESVSGLTTTGASILTEIESLPKGILFWRSFSHFLGGMGVLVFMMAIFPMDDAHSMHLLRAEVPGPVKGKLVPRMRSTARILYLLYLALTVAEMIFLLCGGLSLYDSAVCALSTAGTGGFAVLNESIAGYGSVYVEMVIAVFMLLFGVNFNLYYIALLRRSFKGFKSEELFCYLAIIVFATGTIAINISSLYGSVGESLRYSFFQVTAIISSTGFGTADFNVWPAYSRTLLVMLMVVGACAGSTGGGTKVSRLLIVVKASGAEIRRLLFPRSITRVTIDGERLQDDAVRNTMAYYMLYALIVAVCCLLLSLTGTGLETCFTAVIACLSNIGPGLGLVGPAANYAFWGWAPKLLLCLCMLLGRLEIFPMIMLFSPGVWVKQKKSERERLLA